MNKRIISTVLSLSLAATMCGGFATTASAAAKTPKYQTKARQMEELNRGLIAVYRTQDSQNVDKTGVYLSWRLLGDEPLESQEYDIYKNDAYLTTTTGVKGTNYIDEAGKTTDTYKVVKAGASAAEVAAEQAVTPASNHVAARSQYTDLANSFTYMDIPIERPADEKSIGGDWSYYYNLDKTHEGGANDASVGDLDGDGDYEIVLKWDPTNSKDAADSGYSGRVYIDAYEIDPNLKAEDNVNGHLYKWRIDLGQNIRAGAHDTQFLVYDFDGDGDSEIAMQTALGSKDGKGEFVTKVGDTEEIKNYTDEENNTVYERKGHNIGPDFYTVFDGKTGAALCTTAGIPLGRVDGGDWGDSKMQRSHRFLGAVAYLDGVHPSIVMCRGYYARSVVRAYTWDGSEMALQWEHIGAEKNAESLYGQGNHNLSVADVDNDGRDEIVYGSAVLDDNGKAIGNTYLGHGDAIHVNDFNNDGVQEVFSVKEKPEGYKNNAADFRVAGIGKNIWGKGASGDTGRGVMDNIDDAYAAANPDALSLAWSSSHTNVFDIKGNELKTKPANAGSGTFDNFLVFWDGDLSRELLDANIIQKYDAANGWTKRFWGESDGYTLTGGTTNNYTKRNPCLSADLWGDWREEIIMAAGKGKDETPTLRIFTSTLPTDYRLTTLMHDCQYREAIAWQNVAYNQPPHTSYYVGSAALATDASGNTLNYLAPAVAYTNVTYEAPHAVAVTGISFESDTLNVEKGKTSTINAIIAPTDATKKGITWTSDNEKVATVSNGTVKGVSEGTATITATTKDGGFTATCKVTVFQNHVTGIRLSNSKIELGTGGTAQLKAYIEPADATDQTVTWTSANESVATVDADGVVKGILDGTGTTTVTATTNDGSYSASCTVNVFPLQTTDETGDGVFVTSNTDAETVLDPNTATSASLKQTQATVPGEFHKDFTPYSEDKATLSFRINTGGAKEGTDYTWTLGHTYNSGVKLLDTNGNTIIDLYDVHTTSGVSTKYKLADGAEQDVSTWTNLLNGSDSPLNRSLARWDVTAEFDYDKNICTVTLSGCNNQWVIGTTYQTQFSLNGASFKRIQYYTDNIKDYVTIAPTGSDTTLANLKYERTVALIPSNKISGTKTDTKEVSYTAVLLADYNAADVIGAVYDSDGNLLEVKSDSVNKSTGTWAENSYNGKLTFDTDITDKTVKLYMWDSLKGMAPLASCKTIAGAPSAEETPAPTTAASAAPAATPTATPIPTATPTPTPVPTPTATPTPKPTINPDVTYTDVFTSSENFLMEDDTANNKWIISSDGVTKAENTADSTKTVTASEISDDKGGNTTAKLYLANKAVMYELDEAISSGCFRLSYDVMIDKTTDNNSYGRYFRTYLDNTAHEFNSTTGKSSENVNTSAFFHMMDFYDKVYTTSDVDLIAANENNADAADNTKLPSNGSVLLSETGLTDDKWYRVVVEGDLTNDIVIISYYDHGDAYNADLDITSETPVIQNNGCFTEGRTKSIAQIKLMRTKGGDLYFDNIKLEKETTATE